MPGAPYGSAGTHDVAVERIEEGAPAVGTDITVWLATDGSSAISTTAAQLGAALANQVSTGLNPGAAAFWTSSLVTVAQLGDGTGLVSAASKTNLSSGTSSVKAHANFGASNSGITVTAQLVGTAGNNISLTLINPGTPNAKFRMSVGGNGSSGNSLFRATYDANLAAGGERAGQSAQVDTSGYLITPWDALTRAKPSAWGLGEESKTGTYSISSNAPGDTIATVTFASATSGAQYSIQGGPPGVFTIGATTGVVTTASESGLAAGTYTLTVTVEDSSGYEDATTLVVTVTS